MEVTANAKEVIMDDDGFSDNIRRLVYSAVDPHAVFQRAQCRAFVNEFYRRFGSDVLVDILVAVDATEVMSTAIVADRGEVEAFAFNKYGIFDQDLFNKMQLTTAWDNFQQKLLELSGDAAAAAIEEVLESERQ